MNLLLHTIALEPARWTAQRVSRALVELIPAIAAAGFDQLEVFEPHVTMAPDKDALRAVMQEHGIEPVILSSYLQLNPALADDNDVAMEAAELQENVETFGFRKVRLFPGPQVKPTDLRAVGEVADRIGRIANLLPETQILLETHDGSIADDRERMLELVEGIGLENIGLCWQPTIFKREAASRQWDVQKAHVRHIHLQNRWPDLSFCRLEEGTVDWRPILGEAQCSASIEFVPSGIRSDGSIDLASCLQEAVEEVRWSQSVRL